MAMVAELDPRASWYRYERPFRHFRADRVFRADCYGRLLDAFGAIRDGGPTGTEHAARFGIAQPGYDALVVAMNSAIAARFSPLFERPWLDFLAQLLDLPSLAHVDGGLHHVPQNSRSGWIHNDFCSAWFDDRIGGDVVFPDRTKCDYFSGTVKSADARPHEYVRAATMIFYLGNDGWRSGFGGETGLYQTASAGVGGECAVPPTSNSLLVFECSPHSYHRLLENPGCPRNSIILWLHDTVDHAECRWGAAVTRRKPR